MVLPTTYYRKTIDKQHLPLTCHECSMGNIVALIENYPDLKSDQHVNQLLASINETEEQISAARRFYNAAVTEYNNALEMFPSNIVASYMRYRSKELFVTPAEERANVNVGELLN